MDHLTSPRVIKDILQRYGFQFRKSLGQNFLIDENILTKILDGAAIDENENVLEIGPGIGTLTQKLAQRAKRVVAVEIDRALLPILDETLAEYKNAQVLWGDILKIDIQELIDRYFDGAPFKVAANLPYYITTPIVMRFLEEGYPFQTIVIMIQKEVAERMAASPGTKEYGALSVGVQYFTRPRIIGKVPANVFMPPPKVDSIIIALDKRQRPAADVKDRKLFFQVVKAAFGQRRKTLLNTLSASSLIHEGKEGWRRILEECGIDPERRGETLSLEEFGELSNCTFRYKQEEPE